jgi:hypothetical protein
LNKIVGCIVFSVTFLLGIKGFFRGRQTPSYLASFDVIDSMEQKKKKKTVQFKREEIK